MAKHHTTMRFEQHIITALDERGQRSVVVNRDLERLYTLYDRSLRRASLTLDEACLVTDALNASLYDAKTARLLPAAIRDAIQLDGLDRKWGVDGEALIQKLSALDEFACMAIIDAAERVWADESERDFREVVTEKFGIKIG